MTHGGTKVGIPHGAIGHGWIIGPACSYETTKCTTRGHGYVFNWHIPGCTAVMRNIFPTTEPATILKIEPVCNFPYVSFVVNIPDIEKYLLSVFKFGQSKHGIGSFTLVLPENLPPIAITRTGCVFSTSGSSAQYATSS